MLQTVYSVYDRVRRPLRNHHYLVLPGGRLAYARIPGLPQQLAHPVLAALGAGSEDSGWFDDVELLTGRELQRRYADIAVFAFVQPPAERVAAAYETVIASGRTLPTFYFRHGFSADMSLAQFVQRICQIGDMSADNLFRSQAHILDRRPAAPCLCLRTDRLATDWPKLSALVKEQGGSGIPAAPEMPVPSPHLASLARDPLDSLLSRRYARDITTYFSN